MVSLIALANDIVLPFSLFEAGSVIYPDIEQGPEQQRPNLVELPRYDLNINNNHLLLLSIA